VPQICVRALVPIRCGDDCFISYVLLQQTLLLLLLLLFLFERLIS
jgi:hypothetical protein